MTVSSVTPGVVLKTKFATSNLKAYQEYVDYVDREDAKKEYGAHEKLFTLYQDYLSNPDKTSSLFTDQSDGLNEEEKKNLKQVFETAQANNSIMWQDVITFHNPWLEEQGLYDSRRHTVDEKKVMDITRKAVNDMIKREKLNGSAVWSAAIHYNTNNIHIHIATVEPHPTRERGMRKQSSLDAMKAKVVNQMTNRRENQKKINELIRKDMVDHKKKDSSLAWRNRELKPLFLLVYNYLPQDKRQWQYSYNTLKPLKPYIDTLSEKYIQKYHPKEYQQLMKTLDGEVNELKKAYGEGKVNQYRYKDYKQNKIDELYQRMGNAFLQEMKTYDKKQQRAQNLMDYKKSTKRPKGFQQHVSIHASLKRMERAFKSEYESWKNQQHYERMQRESQRNQQQHYEDERSY
ncbi:MobP2 family relaxase [Priestia megaterium]|uniref:MobP2 family relaxase n=1 Tax=Priestia megaterium TaxID=1404 RepID=UPI0024467923|nr:MobP2 family relaxase [Priestia megaterium]MEE3897222.1 MobP2 family relaxase [Priestia megaterium]WRQ95718.1 MobP2 family relaxase [Priestia megaterium]